MDCFSGIFIFMRLNSACVVFASHGETKFSRLFPVLLLVSKLGCEGWLGDRCKRRGASNKGSEESKFGLKEMENRDRKDNGNI